MSNGWERTEEDIARAATPEFELSMLRDFYRIMIDCDTISPLIDQLKDEEEFSIWPELYGVSEALSELDSYEISRRELEERTEPPAPTLTAEQATALEDLVAGFEMLWGDKSASIYNRQMLAQSGCITFGVNAYEITDAGRAALAAYQEAQHDNE